MLISFLDIPTPDEHPFGDVSSVGGPAPRLGSSFTEYSESFSKSVSDLPLAGPAISL
jgi:hypothetical protein